jgi:hypothetical protein
MLDVNILIKTLDDVIVFQVGRMLGKLGEKDSKYGIYVAEFSIPSYTLNAGKYKAEVFFGENQRHIVYSGFEQCFDVENTLSDMGYNQAVLPGLLRFNNNDVVIQYEG